MALAITSITIDDPALKIFNGDFSGDTFVTLLPGILGAFFEQLFAQPPGRHTGIECLVGPIEHLFGRSSLVLFRIFSSPAARNPIWGNTAQFPPNVKHRSGSCRSLLAESALRIVRHCSGWIHRQRADNKTAFLYKTALLKLAVFHKLDLCV